MASPFETKNIRIVSRREDADFEEARPPERMHDDVQNLHAAAVKGKPWAVEKLKDRIRHFPKYPVFKNLLFTAYITKNNLRAAREVAEQMYREHPEYVYARTNLAEILLDTDGDMSRVRELLHPSLNITETFPNRKFFHFGEFVNYERVVIRYLVDTGAMEAAISRLNLLKESGFADAEVLRSLHAYIEENKPYDPVLPGLQTPGLEVLYFAGQYMSPEVAQDILTEPRATLIADLCRILDDAVDRSIYWMKEEHPDFATFAPIHAMILLAELEAEEALPAILRFLSQPDEHVDFWLGDIVTELLPEIMGRFASPAQYETLAQFATNKRIGEFICGAVISGVTHRAGRQPELQQGATSWLAGIIEKLMPHATPGDYNGHLDQAVSEIIEMQAESLLPLAEKCFQLDLIDESIQGDYQEFLEHFHSNKTWPDKPNYPDLAGVYQFIKGFGWYEPDDPPDRPGNIWMEQIKASIAAHADETNEEEDDDEQTPSLTFRQPAPAPSIAKATPSLNAPCPCGSGKKYKRCCGKEK